MPSLRRMTSPAGTTEQPPAPPASDPPPPAQPPAQPPAKPTEPKAGDKAAAQPAAPAGERTFTQAELDAIITQRLARERDAMLQRLGLKPEDDPAAQLEQARTGATKAQERADRADARALALAAGVKPERVDTFVRLLDLPAALRDVDRGDDARVTAAIKGEVERELQGAPEFKAAAYPAASGPDGSGQPAGVTLAQFKAMDVDARTALYQRDQEAYRSLAEQERDSSER